MNLTIKILLIMTLFIHSITVFAKNNNSYELTIIDDDQQSDANEISTFRPLKENDDNKSLSNENTNTNTKKNIFTFDQTAIDKNIEQFNNIMHTGRDYLNPLPFPKKLNDHNRIRIYTMVVLSSIIIGFTAVIPISSTIGLLTVNEDNIEKLLAKLLNGILISKNFDVNFMNESNQQYLKDFFNNSQNFFIKDNFFYLLATITPLLSAITYSNIYFISNIIVAKKNNKRLDERSLVSKITKIILNIFVVSIYLYGLVDTMNYSLQTINNLNYNQALDIENPVIKYLGTALCTICSFEISFYVSMPVISLLVDTLGLIPEVILRKKINFKEMSMPKILHYFLDSETTLDTKKRFVLNLLQDKFKTKNNYSMVHNLQLMNLNLNESICLSGIINNIKSVGWKKDGYIFKEKNTDIEFTIGITKLAFITASLFVLYKVGSNIYTSLKIAESLYSNGYYFMAINILDENNIFNQIIGNDNEYFKNITELFNIELKKQIETNIEKESMNYLNLSTQLSVYASAGILHIALDTIDKTYSLIKHKGKLYRSPVVITSAILSGIMPIIACYTMIDYFASDTKYLEDSEKIQQHAGFDTSVLGINSLNVKINIIKAALGFAILQSYKIFLPITTPLAQQASKLWNYLIKK